MSSTAVELGNIILGSCLSCTRDEAVRVLLASPIKAEDFREDRQFELYVAMILVLGDQQAITLDRLILKNPSLDLAWVRSIERFYDEEQIQSAILHLIDINDRERMLKGVQEALKKLKDATAAELRNKIASAIQPVDRKAIVSLDAYEIIREAAKVEGGGDSVSTGIGWMDFVMNGGWYPRQHVAIGAPEKSRKTTFARNAILNTLFPGQPGKRSPNKDICVMFAAFENDRFVTARDFMAMLMAEHLLFADTEHITEAIRDEGRRQIVMAHELLNGDSLRTTVLDENGRCRSRMPKPIQRAFEYAADLMASNPDALWIYDQSPEGGNMVSVHSLRERMREHDALIRKGRKMILVVDYIGLVQAPEYPNQYNAQRYITMELQQWSVAYDLSVLTLAQYTRSMTSKRAENGDIGIIPVENNPDLARVVQFFFEVSVEEENPEQLKASVVLARRSAKGSHRVYRIHPPSGMFMGEMSQFKEGERLPKTRF